MLVEVEILDEIEQIVDDEVDDEHFREVEMLEQALVYDEIDDYDYIDIDEVDDDDDILDILMCMTDDEDDIVVDVMLQIVDDDDEVDIGELVLDDEGIE